MTAERALALLLAAATAAGCSRGGAGGAIPDLSDAPVLAPVVRRDIPESVPAYGISLGAPSGERFEATVEAADAAKVRPGQRAFASVLPSTAAVRCRVVRVMRGASAETGQAIVWLRASDGSRVPLNDFVFVRISVGVRRGVLTVPRQAVMVRADRTMVVRAEKDAAGKVSYVPAPVTLGQSSGGAVEIRSGLRAGDQVVAVAGIGLLDPGFKAEGGD